MSEWTYVRGSVLVGIPGYTQQEKDKVIAALLDELPQVTGSEGPMCVQALMLRGYGEHPNPELVEEGILEGPVTQDFYNIILTGFLRNRFLSDTTDELYDFFLELAKRVHIEDMAVSCRGINEEYEYETRLYNKDFVDEISAIADDDFECVRNFYQRITNG